MKKIMITILVLTVMVITFTACGGSKLDNSKNISVTAREDGSGTKSAFMEIIGLKGKADPLNTIIQTGTAAVFTEVKNNPSAIAYESLGYITDEVKVLSVDGVQATNDNIKNGTYKIARPLSVIFKPAMAQNAVNRAFLEFVKSSDAQKIISDNKYVSIVDNAPKYMVDGSLTGMIDVSGSTSVQPLMIKLAAEFEKLQQNVKITVSGGGTGTGYKNAENGTSTFGMISADFDQKKAADCVPYTLAKDGIGIIVNKTNTITDISIDQLKNIYDVDAGTNALTKWSQVNK